MFREIDIYIHVTHIKLGNIYVVLLRKSQESKF